MNLFLNQFPNDKKSIICVSGRAFDELLRKMLGSSNDNSNVHRIIDLIEQNGVIFYRMSPTNKMDLVKFYKRKSSNVVAMCGDGANDCAALLFADTGIALSHSKSNNITAHYYCYKDSISAVETIIKYGRACFENSIIMFKYMILYAFIQITSNLILYYYNQDFIDVQYLFMDGVTVLTGCLILSK
jgi:cation-transporting ATPase 13A2